MQVVDTPLAVAVIVAVPVLFPVTFPPLTTATFLSEVFHFTDFEVPTMVGVSFMELPLPFVLSCIVFIFKDILLSFTVTTQEAVLSLAFAVIVALPADTEVTLPLLSTVATSGLSLVHSTVFEAPFTVAFN